MSGAEAGPRAGLSTDGARNSRTVNAKPSEPFPREGTEGLVHSPALKMSIHVLRWAVERQRPIGVDRMDVEPLVLHGTFELSEPLPFPGRPISLHLSLTDTEGRSFSGAIHDADVGGQQAFTAQLARFEPQAVGRDG